MTISTKRAKEKTIDNVRIALFAREIAKSYAFADVECPPEKILFSMAKECAEEIKTPNQWVERLFLCARRDFRQIPKLKDLTDCHREIIKNEMISFSQKRICSQKKREQVIDDEEYLLAKKAFWIEMIKKGFDPGKEIRDRYCI